MIVAPRAKSVCSFVSLVQTNLGTKSVCNLVTKRSNGFLYMNLDHSRFHKIEKTKQNGFGSFSLKFFVPVSVGVCTRSQVPIKQQLIQSINLDVILELHSSSRGTERNTDLRAVVDFV